MTTVNKFAAAVLLVGSSLAATPVLADEIDGRQARQIERIQQGVRSGQLTRYEAHGLIAEQRRIAEMERRAKRDGHVDRFERREIDAAQDRANRHIFAEKHDGDARPRNGYGPRQGYWGYRRWWN